jgi:hypothetical protein
MPEGLFGPEIDIRHTAVEGPRKSERPFVVEHVVDEETWQQLSEQLKVLWQRELNIDCIPLAYSMHLIFPERASDLGLDEEAWRRCQEMLKFMKGGDAGDTTRSERERNFLQLLRETARIKTLFPERANELTLDPTKLDRFLGSLQTANDISNARGELSALKIILGKDPIDLSRPEVVETVQGYITTARKFVAMGKTDSGRKWRTFAKSAADIRICLEENFDPRVLSENDWHTWNEELARCKIDSRLDRFGRGFAELAAYMKILAADGIRVTDQGIEFLARPTTDLGAAQELPERRAY